MTTSPTFGPRPMPWPEPAFAAGHAPNRAGLSLPYIGALDGLRGLAVLGVLLFHGGIALTGGFLGVSTFFTLSGFLITTLLLTEHAGKGGINLVAFWGRRFRRLLPAALVAVTLAAVFVWLTGEPSQATAFRGDGLAALAYVANWHFVLDGQSYATLFSAPSPVLHFWSLAIEEQFYVLFPLLTAGGMRLLRGSRAGFAGWLAILFVASAALPHLWPMSNDRVYFGTDTRAAEVLAGALLAVVLGGSSQRSRSGRSLDRIDERWGPRARITVGSAGAGALAVMVLLWWRTTESTPWVHAGGLPVYAGLTVMVILASLMSGGPVRALLSATPLRLLGKISYGVYLYHWPVFLWLTTERTGLAPLPRFAIASAVAIAMATVSYVLIEQPLRTGRHLRPHWHPRLAPVAAALVALLVFAGTSAPTPASTVDLNVAAGSLVSDVDQASGLAGPLDTSPPSTAPNVAAAADTTAPPTTTPPATAAPSTTAPAGPLPPKPVQSPSRPLRVLLVGDSTAVFLNIALNTWGQSNKIWGTSSYARIGCGISRGGQRTHRDVEEWIPKECGSWATDWPRVLRQIRPDIVVVTSAFWDSTDRKFLNDEQWRKPGDPVYDEYVRNEFGAAADVLGASGAAVTWLDNAPLHLGRKDPSGPKDWPVNEPARMDATNAILHEVAATRPFLRIIPFASFMKTWPGGPFDLRPDGVHVDDHGGPVTAAWLGAEILDAYWDVKRSVGS